MKSKVDLVFVKIVEEKEQVVSGKKYNRRRMAVAPQRTTRPSWWKWKGRGIITGVLSHSRP
ncbi:unnamed protein product, partial [Brassica oleracea]